MADVDHELSAIRFVVVSHILRVIDEFRLSENRANEIGIFSSI